MYKWHGRHLKVPYHGGMFHIVIKETELGWIWFIPTEVFKPEWKRAYATRQDVVEAAEKEMDRMLRGMTGVQA